MFKKIIRLLISLILIITAFALTIMQQIIIDSINNDWVYSNASYIIMVLQIMLIVIAVINVITMFKHIKAPKEEVKLSHLNKTFNNSTFIMSAKQRFNHKQKRVLDKLNNLHKH